MNLYKIVNQLSEPEFQEIYATLEGNNAQRSLRFLACIREDPEQPDKIFLEREDITPAAFYVLKSRLAQKVEGFLLNRLGDTNLALIHRVMNVSDLVYDNPRDIAIAALGRLEKELIKLDFPYGLMIVYKELQNLHAYDDDGAYYKRRYQQQVAYTVAMDKSEDLVRTFFQVYDQYYLRRTKRDLTQLTRIIEKLHNLNHLYESHRLFVNRALVHMFAQLFLPEMPDLRCELMPAKELLAKVEEIREAFENDPFYRRLDLLLNFFRYMLAEQQGKAGRAQFFYETLDYKLDSLLTGYHLQVNTSLFLFAKLRHHLTSHTQAQLIQELEAYNGNIPVEPYRLTYYVNYHLFRAYAYFFNGQYHEASQVLFWLMNEVNLKRETQVYLECRMFLALCYVKKSEYDLGSQTILALQRTLRKDGFEPWGHGKHFLKALNTELGARPSSRERVLREQIELWEAANQGAHALLPLIDLSGVFLGEPKAVPSLVRT